MSTHQYFRNVSLPAELVDKIETFIQEHPEYGYMSISEFVRSAVRRAVSAVVGLDPEYTAFMLGERENDEVTQ